MWHTIEPVCIGQCFSGFRESQANERFPFYILMPMYSLFVVHLASVSFCVCVCEREMPVCLTDNFFFFLQVVFFLHI